MCEHHTEQQRGQAEAPLLSVRQGEPQQGEAVIGGGGGAARLKDRGQWLARDFSRWGVALPTEDS